MRFQDIFPKNKPIIACIHLLPLPGAPLYNGNMHAVYEQALMEVEIFKQQGIHGLIIENFRDKPFFPTQVPAETIAAMSSIAREITHAINVPIGINILRNDAEAALAVATAVGAEFIRVNVHTNAIACEQGILSGLSYKTLRLRSTLKSNVLLFADVGVKHSTPLVARGLAMEAKDAEHRGLADALIVSGELTGSPTEIKNIETVKANSSLPLLIGSGTTPENIGEIYDKVEGFIVGSYFKKEGRGDNFVEAERVAKFMRTVDNLVINS